MSASVKIMLSYDYCHFEVSKSSDQELTDKQINEMRKDVQRLADEAVRQYKIAKQEAAYNLECEEKRDYFLRRVTHAEKTPQENRTPEQIAVLKQYQEEEWQSQFEQHDYDYEDDDETYDWDEED